MLLATIAPLALSLVATTDSRHAPLLSWLAREGAVVGPVALGKSSIGAGYGAFATEDVAEGAALFTVPSSACIGLFDACGDEVVGEMLARLTTAGQGGATVALAGFLAKEWLCGGADGPRGAYLAMLPWEAEWPPEANQEQEHVLWWSERQVDSLEGSDALGDAVAIRDQVALATKVLRGVLGASVRNAYKERGEPIWNVWKADDDIDRAVRGAFVSILTRAFTQENSQDEENRLVPLLDMLQHSSDPNIRHGLELADEGAGTPERVVVRARRPLLAGEELLNSYDDGEYTADKFLSRFGFVPGKSVGEFVGSLKT